jgi:hypothetical protein
VPRAYPVEFHVSSYLASSVSLHGTSPWHPKRIFVGWRVAEIVRLQGTSPWHLDKPVAPDKPVASSMGQGRGIFTQYVARSLGSLSWRVAPVRKKPRGPLR